MTIHERERGRVRLYACGGGGVNMGHKVDHVAQDQPNVFAQLDVVYLDTSKSNLHPDIRPESVYLVEVKGKDGSGGIRKENYPEIDAHTREMLQIFKPAELNIVLSTGGGGSGSVIAPSLVSELLARDQLAVVICVGDDSTMQFAGNTLNTLKSYDQIAKLRQEPVVTHYIQNSAEMTRAVVDRRIQHLVSALCLLFSRRNRELDSKDLYNWLHYQKVTSYRPTLTALTLVDELDPAHLSQLGNLISIATLSAPDTEAVLPIRPEVQYVGYLESGADKLLEITAPYHYVTSDGVFADVVDGLDRVLREVAEASAARPKKGGISSHADVATESGVVL